MNKKEIRKEMLLKRRALNEDFVEEHSNIIYEKLIKSGVLDEVDNIFIYVSFQNEVKTDKLIKYLLDKNKNVLVPFIDENDVMQAVYYSQNTVKNKYGIDEPKENKIFNKNELGLVVMPLVAFDSNNDRIGFGGGYYDKFLEGLNVKKIGLAYSFQRTTSCFAEKTDVKIDQIYTD